MKQVFSTVEFHNAPLWNTHACCAIKKKPIVIKGDLSTVRLRAHLINFFFLLSLSFKCVCYCFFVVSVDRLSRDSCLKSTLFLVFNFFVIF